MTTTTEKGWEATCPKTGSPHYGCGVCNPTRIKQYVPMDEQNWEEEFDAKLESGAFHNPIDGVISAERIKEFIRVRIAAGEKSGAGKIIRVIEIAGEGIPKEDSPIAKFGLVVINTILEAAHSISEEEL